MTEPTIHWRRPRGVPEGADCVETAALPDGTVAIRNSAEPDGTVVIYTRREIDAFVKGVKAGEFDDLIV